MDTNPTFLDSEFFFVCSFLLLLFCPHYSPNHIIILKKYIVCLGWGSLIWDPRELQAKPEWRTDGPQLSIEFARQSGDGRITLVIESSAPKVSVLWSEMTVSSLERATENLRKREKTVKKFIGSWSLTKEQPKEIPGLGEWANSVGATGVIWTALPPKFNGRDGIVPSLGQLLTYFRELDDGLLAEAERYIRKAPQQIQTPYRKALKKEFGW